MSVIFSNIIQPRQTRGLPGWLLACLWLFILVRAAAATEIAIIPYRIDNPSTNFPARTGTEYARLLGVAAIIAKEGIEVTPPRDVELDLEGMKLSPQEVITKDDLDLLGKSRRIDRFLLGSLSRGNGVYRSESVLYSVRERRIITRTRTEAEDLIGLAEREMKDSLAGYRTRASRHGDGSAVDALFLLDTSYRMNQDWDEVKNAIIDFSSECIDVRRADTRIYILPFSDRAEYAASSVSENSIPSVRTSLDRLKPAGGAHPEDFTRSLRYAVKNISWRAAAAKVIIIIANSVVTSGAAEQYAVTCRNRGIVIHAVSLGRIPGDASEIQASLARIAGGSHRHAAYHQRLFNAAGDAREVFLENGRLFRSSAPEPGWRAGLYEAGSGGKPRRFLEEVLPREREAPSPYALPDSFSRISMERIINQERLESNVGTLVGAVAKKVGAGKSGRGRPAGRALLTDGKVSFWVQVPDMEFMEFFEARQKAGYLFPLGVTVKRDNTAPYGVTLVPLVKGLTADFIPECLKATPGDIVRRSEQYLSRGLFFPPVWFLNVKVGEAERSRRGRDIRGR